MSERHVLVVDDNPDDATVLSHIIGFIMNLQVSSAANGQEALDMAREKQFDLVILDLNMPSMDGVNLTQELRGLERYKTIPIIAVTAYDTASDQLRTLRAGCNLYMTKPISIERMMEAISQYLTP